MVAVVIPFLALLVVIGSMAQHDGWLMDKIRIGSARLHRSKWTGKG